MNSFYISFHYNFLTKQRFIDLKHFFCWAGLSSVLRFRGISSSSRYSPKHFVVLFTLLKQRSSPYVLSKFCTVVIIFSVNIWYCFWCIIIQFSLSNEKKTLFTRISNVFHIHSTHEAKANYRQPTQTIALLCTSNIFFFNVSSHPASAMKSFNQTSRFFFSLRLCVCFQFR